MPRTILICILTVLAGCVDVKPVADAAVADDMVEWLPPRTFNCTKPYQLTHYCDWASGGTYRAVIDHFDIDLAFSDDGRVVLITDAHQDWHDVFRNPFIFNSPTTSGAVNRSYQLVRRVLDHAGIPVERVRAMKMYGNIIGYVLELREDGFPPLAAYSPSTGSS
jgi:hypothetical protein